MQIGKANEMNSVWVHALFEAQGMGGHHLDCWSLNESSNQQVSTVKITICSSKQFGLHVLKDLILTAVLLFWPSDGGTLSNLAALNSLLSALNSRQLLYQGLALVQQAIPNDA